MVGEYDMEKEWIDFIHSTSVICGVDSDGNLYEIHNGQYPYKDERYYEYIKRRLREEDGKS